MNNLIKYIEEDKVYQEYKKGQLKECSDFDMFCINHCKDIERVLKALENKDKAIKELRECIDNDNNIMSQCAKELENSISTDKIKAKMEEIENDLDSSQGCMDEEKLNELFIKIRAYRELLEEDK